jgi:hypothetical protein
MKTRLISVAAAFGLALAATAALADKAPEHGNNCFLSNNWKNWTASPDGDTLYLRIELNKIYRVDLTPGSHAHKYPGSFLVNQVRGSNWICSPLDLDLTLADDAGMRQPLIARSLRELTPAEIAAIPKKDRP